MSFPISREDLQLMPMQVCEERRQAEIEKFKIRTHADVLATATAGRTQHKVLLTLGKQEDYELISAILFKTNLSPLKKLKYDEQELVVSILKINLRSMYPDCTIQTIEPSPYNCIHKVRGPQILIDWS